MGLQRGNTKVASDVSSYVDEDAENEDTTLPEPPEDDGTVPEDEDEATERSSSLPKRGWGAAKKAIAASGGDFGNEFKIQEEESLLKFLEDEPFASIQEHWVDEITEGKRSFYCPGRRECPLCKAGHKPKSKSFFNVTEISGDEPIAAFLVAGPALTKKIEKEHEGKGGPIDRHYWRVSKSGGGKKGPVTYSLAPVKARDLPEDYELDADEVAASLKGLVLYKEDFIKYPSRQTLQDVVDEHLQDD